MWALLHRKMNREEFLEWWLDYWCFLGQNTHCLYRKQEKIERQKQPNQLESSERWKTDFHSCPHKVKRLQQLMFKGSTNNAPNGGCSRKKNQIKCRPAVVFPSEEKPGTYFHKHPITYPASHFFFAFVLHMPYLFSWHIESTVDPFHPAASIPHRVIVNSQAVNSLSPKREACTILPEASTPCNTPKYRIYQCSHPTGPYLLRSSAEPGS